MEQQIVVVQDGQDDLHGIRVAVARIDEVRAEEIVYTDDPSEVVAIAAQHPSLFVVCDEMQSGELVTELAARVKEINACALLYLYALRCEKSAYLDGVIAKKRSSDSGDDHRLLANILVSDLTRFDPSEWPMVVATPPFSGGVASMFRF